uniref:hypothetical protein n=1 Tax=Aeromonas sp. Ne-1 TaxID=1675689 RepID=UPI0015674A8B|nr:hypothetical protein [Aeromonas sp. Ne-1]
MTTKTKMIRITPESAVPTELKDIQAYWKEEADFYGDKGACVLGAGFEFTYQNQRYFMPPMSIWQGSVSWEHCKDDIQNQLIEIGASEIRYDYGVMD